MPTKKSSTEPKRAQQPKFTRVLVKCAHCGEEFSVSKSQSQQRFCSTSCAHRLCVMHKNRAPAQGKKTPTEVDLPSQAALPKTPSQLTAFRRALGRTQHNFWARVGVTQSGGSRYEQGCSLPRTVVMLLDIVYIKGITPARLAPNDFAILELLKAQHPDLYKSLNKAAKKMDRFVD